MYIILLNCHVVSYLKYKSNNIVSHIYIGFPFIVCLVARLSFPGFDNACRFGFCITFVKLGALSVRRVTYICTICGRGNCERERDVHDLVNTAAFFYTVAVVHIIVFQ